MSDFQAKGDHWTTRTDANQERGVKIRIANVFRNPDQTMVEFNEELKGLTQADLDWFKAEFNAAGFPTR